MLIFTSHSLYGWTLLKTCHRKGFLQIFKTHVWCINFFSLVKWYFLCLVQLQISQRKPFICHLSYQLTSSRKTELNPRTLDLYYQLISSRKSELKPRTRTNYMRRMRQFRKTPPIKIITIKKMLDLPIHQMI